MGAQDIVVTGASGLLGRAVVDHFEAHGDKVVRLAWTRADKDPQYLKLDLSDSKAVDSWVEKTPIDSAKINAAVPGHLASLAKQKGWGLIYISTDYVFNGRKPPYEVNDTPDPLQAYGRQKRDGEIAVLKEREDGAKATILRLPILYGKTEFHGESAVNILQSVIEDHGKQSVMDHYQVRSPTNVEDVARVLFDLCHLGKPLPPILHYTSPAPLMTKYDMTVIIAKHLNLPLDHIKANTAKPEVKPSQTERPENTNLSTKALSGLGVDVGEKESFDAWWSHWVKEQKQ